ncbi:E3 ubiquitin-protein ligase HUWE1 [Orchesella cincta]|uniref:E3 ubiquitin-protein ligase HUWE1 n=1 Tax=Orchesella cincta TaxID=48709 RepID=A0A1D2NK84_ORCCI|nr:E3 ubiquitin-protein ligase HUWE1 [Orchesella cincta]
MPKPTPEGLRVTTKPLEKLHAVLMRLDVLDRTIDSPGSSVLLRELANSKNPVEAVGNCLETPILHDMTAVHSLIIHVYFMFGRPLAS